VSAKMRRSTRRIPALSSTIKNVIYSLYHRSRVQAPVEAMPKIIEHLGQAYISKWTKDIEDATYRTVWFHMGTSPGMSFHTPTGQFCRLACRSLNLPARNPDCAHAQVAAAAVVRWDGGCRSRNQSRG
jgi:hypothetical protein